MGIEISFGPSVKEQYLTILVLLALCIVYVYLLVSPAQLKVPLKPLTFVIQKETKENFDAFMKSFLEVQGDGYSSGGGSRLWDDWTTFGDTNHSSKSVQWDDFSFKGGNQSSYNGIRNKMDDFFLYTEEFGGADRGRSGDYRREIVEEPLTPSSNYYCSPGGSYVTLRSETNYKQLWMHSSENLWMGASATMDTPLHRKAFEVVPVYENCGNGGWVRLRQADLDGFIYIIPPLRKYNPQNISDVQRPLPDEWVVKEGSSSLDETFKDRRYHFLLEQDGFILSNVTNGCINVISRDSEYPVRGHTSGWEGNQVAAGREYGAMLKINFVDKSAVDSAMLQEKDEISESLVVDKKYIEQIEHFETSSEKRVISFGLYGSKPKYTEGAIRNAELAKIYFPGWVCRYYVLSDVPEAVVSKLKSLGAEIEVVPDGMGYVSGMFWRFMVAGDPTVDRYIIRDVDSRLNARDRFAVEEWIRSGKEIHILRDHVNHCLPINGGMWGGVKGALPNIQKQINEWKTRDEYLADLHFLEDIVWPEVQDRQISHDSYCCDRYSNTKPFPTRRYMTYQHVGQVFDAQDNPRMLDIDGYIRGMPIPSSCRKFPDWIYG